MKYTWKFSVTLWLLGALFVTGCTGTRYEGPAEPMPAPDPMIRVTILQMNDVYEIQPVSGGTRGGLARVATIRKQLLAENPNTFTVIAGDFFSPSALGTAVVEGKQLDGRQMVAVLNTMGLDYATFGNHEFDLKKDPFYERMGETQFTWVSGNVFDAEGKPYAGVKSHEIIDVPGPGGATLRLGLVGVTLRNNKPGYVTYSEPLKALQEEVKALQGRADVIVALTHLAFTQDQVMAEQVPELDLILGGHEHDNMLLRRGADYTPILKADANAKSVYVHRLAYDLRTKKVEIASTFVPVTDAIADDPETAQVVEEWVDKGFKGFEARGFKPRERVANTNVDLDGLESSVRHRPTNLTRLIADAMVSAATGTELGVFNSGSIRIDDKITKGSVTQYDVLRVLPFGGKIFKVALKGSMLDSVLTQGTKTPGGGNFLQTTANVASQKGTWTVGGKPLDPDRVYLAAINSYLACGRQNTLTFLNVNDTAACGENTVGPPNPSVKLEGVFDDIRQALIKELRKKYPPNS